MSPLTGDDSAFPGREGWPRAAGLLRQTEGPTAGKKPLAAKNQRDHFPVSPKFMPSKQGVCSGRGKAGYGFLSAGDSQGTLACRCSSLGARTCETQAETQQLISCNAGR